jgi:hypothetical protein
MCGRKREGGVVEDEGREARGEAKWVLVVWQNETERSV